MAEEEVEADSHDPAEHDLIVGVHTVVNSAEGDQEEGQQGQRERNLARFSFSFEVTTD